MAVIYLIGLVLIGVFSGLVGTYWGIYKVRRGRFLKGAAGAGIAIATFFLTTALGIFAIWPPFWPL